MPLHSIPWPWHLKGSELRWKRLFFKDCTAKRGTSSLYKGIEKKEQGMIRLYREKRSLIAKNNLVLWLLALSIPLALLNSKSGTEAAQHESKDSPRSLYFAKPSTASLKGRAAPDFSLESITGEKYKLADTRGKVVLIDFWHTY